MRSLLPLYRNLILSAGAAALLSGCVTARVHDDLKYRYSRLETEAAACRAAQDSLGRDRAGLTKRYTDLSEENTKLKRDTAEAGQLYRRNKVLLNDLFDKYDRLERSYNQLLANSANESGRLAGDVSRKERELLDLERRLSSQKTENDKLSSDLQAREGRVKELERVLADKDRAVNDLQKKVQNALLSFQGADLTVNVRNGKVYVSLAEKLLFKSGSTVVDPKGTDALRRLADVLETQRDIAVMVEGHTDDVPVSKGTACLDDNWDLSVLRATSIVNLLVREGVTPSQLIAAGRGEFAPLAQGRTSADRQRNRRTEIILTPKLDELFRILDSQ